MKSKVTKLASTPHPSSPAVSRKVHLTQTTMTELGGEFEVTPGAGQQRDVYLKENKIETYFIADKEV